MPINQRILLSFLFCLLIANISYAQETLTSEEAYTLDLELSKTVKILLKKKEFHRWYPLHLQRLGLMSKIKNRHAYVLDFYNAQGWNFRILKQPRESLNMYNGFLDYYDANKAFISPELKQRYLELKSFAYRSTALAYQNLSLLDSANFEHQKNLKYMDTMVNIFNPAAINDYGLFLYGGMKNNDLALINFKEAYALTKKHFPEHSLLGSIRDNMATIYFEEGEIEAAKVLYKDNFEFYKKIKKETESYKAIDAFKLVKTGSKLVDIEIMQGNLIQAERAYTELLNVFNTYEPPYKKEETRLEFLKTKQQFLEATQKINMAYVVLKEVNRLSDSINQGNTYQSKERITVINELILDRSKKSFKIEKNLRENKIRSQQLKLWVVTLTSSLVLLLLASLFIRRRQYLTIAKNKQQLAEQSLEFTTLKNEKLNTEIESKKRDLSDFAINLSQNQEWAKVLADKFNHLKTTNGKEHKTLLDDFEQEIYNKIKFDHDNEDFYERLDKLSDSFYSALYTNYPNLTKTEIRLCSLIRLKIDSHAIANLQNITVSSLNTSRYRLRKKLKLSEDDNLDKFIQLL